MKQLNMALELVPKEHRKAPPVVVMCCFTVPDDTSHKDVVEVFQSNFFPAIRSSFQLDEDKNPFSLALAKAMTAVNEQLCGESYLIQADSIAHIIY